MSEVNLSKKPKFFYLPKIIKYIFKYNLSFKSCKFKDDIQSYLINENDEGKEYFQYILKKYIENIKSYNFVEKIYLVSYPHIQHLDEVILILSIKLKLMILLMK